MDRNGESRRRKHLRLASFDYTDQGPYFATLTLQTRSPLFSQIVGGLVSLTNIGTFIDHQWNDLKTRFPGVLLDEYVIMPDHLHGIIQLPGNPDASLGRIMQAFKSITTVEYGRGVAQYDLPSYDRRFWQRGYWEHVIRNERDLAEKRRYIESNPARWEDARSR